MNTTYLRPEMPDNPLRAWVRATRDDGRTTTFQLMPWRPLTQAERTAVQTAGKDPEGYCWVGFPVPKGSEPVKWSEELQAQLKAAQELLAQAGKLCGELVRTDDDAPFLEMFGESQRYTARHFLAVGAAATEEAAEEQVNRKLAPFNSHFATSALWLKSGHGRQAEAKYSY
jgi:hypothetical protein